MIPLQEQDQLEQLLLRGDYKDGQAYPRVVVYFTADWCGACKRVDLPYLMSFIPNTKWYICDVDENNYSPGFAGVSTIPSFLPIRDGKHKPLISTSITEHVAAGLFENLQ